MHWKVNGADSATGEDKILIIEADNEDSARRRAARRGLMVASLKQVQVKPKATAPIARAAPIVPAAPVVAEPAAARPRRLAYARPVTNRGEVADKGTSGLGIAALVLGIIAALFCWIPLLGILSIPIALVGILVGAIGFLVSMLGKKSGVGMPVAGVIVCGLAISVTVMMTRMLVSGFVTGMNAANTAAIQRAKARTAANADATLLAPTPEVTAGVDPWASAGKSTTVGDSTVTVSSASIATVPIIAMGANQSSPRPQLIFQLEINNPSLKQIDYKTWAGAAFGTGDDAAQLSDELGNTYKRVNFGVVAQPAGRNQGAVYPGSKMTDVLIFEVPAKAAKSLRLMLPAGNIGGSGEGFIVIATDTIAKSN